MSDELTLYEIVARQLEDERLAREKFPYDPSECTLYLDTLDRQILFACTTCAPTNALCYSCGIQCHEGHNVVEIDTKREYKCDCGTSRLNSTCKLRKSNDDLWANSHLKYSKNFLGKFCSCNESTTDNTYGSSAMFQCLGMSCQEEWYHARCILNLSVQAENERKDKCEFESDDEGDDLETIFPELPAEFGGLVCPQCSTNFPDVKLACLKEINGFMFLKSDYQSILANSVHLKALAPYFVTKERTYKPKLDTDMGSILEQGERALGMLPHDLVLTNFQKFKQMEDQLVGHLRSIAESGRSVTKADIDTFFNT